MKRSRMLAGAAVLAALGVFLAVLVPSYMDNFEFQRELEEISRDPENSTSPPDVVRIRVVERASRLGLPVSADQVRVVPAAGRTRIEVRYVVRVDLPMYTVDLHFRPSAGGR